MDVVMVAVVVAMPVLVYRRLHKDNRSRIHAARSRDEYLTVVKASLDSKRQANATDEQA